MEYVALVFGILGLIGFLQSFDLKKRIDSLEWELTKMEGTSYRRERLSLLEAAAGYIGKKVTLDLKEDHEDGDIISYGDTRHGSMTLLDADEDWLLVRIESPKWTKEKLIRMESIQRISLKEN